MTAVQELREKVLAGGSIGKEEALRLVSSDLQELLQAADDIRKAFSGQQFDMCAVMSIKGGRCSENCRFCPQARVSVSDIRTFPVLQPQEMVRGAKQAILPGIRHFGFVASGRKMDDAGIENVCRAVQAARKDTDAHFCVSLGLLTRKDLRKLKEAGVSRIHNNLETSERFFPNLCTSHTWREKFEVARMVREEGLELCSGGIFGVGESWEDRIDLALAERKLGATSVPLNMLDPVKGSPLGDSPVLKEDEVLRIVAIFRFVLPGRFLRLAAGRPFLPDAGFSAFTSGANASITGDMLNVKGITAQKDLETIQSMNFCL